MANVAIIIANAAILLTGIAIILASRVISRYFIVAIIVLLLASKIKFKSLNNYFDFGSAIVFYFFLQLKGYSHIQLFLFAHTAINE
jgi:hypothetical protein